MIISDYQLYAKTNESALKSDVKLIYLDFHGLGGAPDPDSEITELHLHEAETGILCVEPCDHPWSWMNREAVRLTDMILDALWKKYNLSQDFPLVSSGQSMGGLSSLIYARYGSYKPVAVAANCPVCDLTYHLHERRDLPRSMYAAFAHYECGFERALELNSPLMQVDQMPDIPYFILHGGADSCVNKQAHSDRFVAAMRAASRTLEYLEVPGMEHCDFASFPQAAARYYDFIYSFRRP